MSLDTILNSLEISWKRDQVLRKIKNGQSTDEIINKFLVKNKEQIKELNSLLRPEDRDLLNKILNSLERSWERDEILLNIKKGLGTDEIVNEFLVKNERQIKELNSLLRPEDIDLLNQVEQLSTCESKLLNEIKKLNYLKNNEKHHILNKKQIDPSNRGSHNKISSFMINWSNKFVIIALLTISAIALSKQAWA